MLSSTLLQHSARRLLPRRVASSSSSRGAARFFSSTTAPPLVRPVRPTNITAHERAAIRAARKERATAALRQAQGGGGASTTTTVQGGGSSSTATTTTTSIWSNPKYARYWWYMGLGVPTLLMTWAIYDESSPPAQVAQAVGLAGLIGDYTSHISKPVYDKLLPDWADVRVYSFIHSLYD